ncbi:hypothetical protein TNCT_549081 [Trichonephila clavata]|uniref:Uncharacterized protein n=1 Tax=Trichonephila clavata TaxID=2740835 RepID=A0A8X6G9T9_TRICU|nr:hypothetical protein TNCT_549081 [Trichonephila clavata]
MYVIRVNVLQSSIENVKDIGFETMFPSSRRVIEKTEVNYSSPHERNFNQEVMTVCMYESQMRLKSLHDGFSATQAVFVVVVNARNMQRVSVFIVSKKYFRHLEER